MSSLDNFVTVNISLSASAPTQKGFGVPMVLGNSQAIAPDLIRSYDAASALSSMVTDGFATTDLEYLQVSKLLSQSPRPSTIKVGRRQNPATQALVFTVPDAVDGKVYTVKVNGVAYSVTGNGVLTATDIAGDIEDLITAASITDLTATDNADGTFDIDMANGSMVAIEVVNVELDDQSTDASFATDIAAIVNVDSSWYALFNTCQGAASITAACAWTETQAKIHGFTTGDEDVAGSGSSDIVSTMGALNYKRSFATFTRAPSEFHSAAWGGTRLPLTPGAATWRYAQPSGISSPSLTATERTNLEGKNCNYLAETNDISYMTKGRMVGGDPIDQTRDIDWWHARLQERVFAALLNNPKIPGTDLGIDIIRAVIEAQNAEAEAQGVFASSSVEMPTQASRSTADKSARALTNVIVRATLAGAIEELTISVNISL